MKPTKEQAAEIRAEIGGRKVIASVSGGKDSAALSLYLKECEIEHDRVFADTGWEAWQTYAYMRDVLIPRLGPIDLVKRPGGMAELVREKAMFPGGTRRFCTDYLKMRPIIEYMAAQPEGTISAVGIRAAESVKRAAMPMWDGYTSKVVQFDIWRPLLMWSEQDVIDIHHRHSLPPNPLYIHGAERVGCWPCIHARKSEVRLIADLDPARIDLVEALEDEATEIARQRADEKGEELKTERTFFIGKGHKRPKIRDVVEWSRTSRAACNSSF